MPTLEHNGFVDLFRDNPPLAPHLLQKLFGVEIPPFTSVTVVEASLDQLLPVEFRADLVLELRDEGGRLVLAIIVEVQRDRDPDKLFSWPVYLSILRARKRCPACVLVVAPDAAVAAWAAAPIDLGLGRSRIELLVLGPSVVPVVTDPAVAQQETELSILSAVVHGNGPRGVDVVLAALGALGRFDDEHEKVYIQIVYRGLREPAKRALETYIMERRSEMKAELPPFFQKLIDITALETMIKEKHETLLRLAARAGIELGEEERARIQACTDAATLDRWVDNILGAKTASDLLT